jgi:predicted tellurium resistance membrane protein TerC
MPGSEKARRRSSLWTFGTDSTPIWTCHQHHLHRRLGVARGPEGSVAHDGHDQKDHAREPQGHVAAQERQQLVACAQGCDVERVDEVDAHQEHDPEGHRDGELAQRGADRPFGQVGHRHDRMLRDVAGLPPFTGAAMTLDNLFTLGMLIFLQAVLGFDNLLYISLESKRVAPEEQKRVRQIGIALAIILRIILLVVVIQAIDSFQTPFAGVHWTGVVEGTFNVHATIVLLGGVFIIYTAFKEITHMLSIDDLKVGEGDETNRKASVAIAWIVVMNLVFSFDSILSAIALTDVVWVMATAIIISGILMILMAETVSSFLQRNRMYEVLGLFILLIVGIMLLSEGGHLAHLKFGGHPVEAMSKTTFYFSIAILVAVDIAQGKYQKKLDKERRMQQDGLAST